MKNIIAKVVGSTAYVAADLGLMAAIVAGLGKIWNKFELTEDYFNDHPKLGIIRLMLRMFVTIGLVILICVAPVMYVIDIIFNWCDNTFGEKPVELKDDWK